MPAKKPHPPLLSPRQLSPVLTSVPSLCCRLLLFLLSARSNFANPALNHVAIVCRSWPLLTLPRGPHRESAATRPAACRIERPRPPEALQNGLLAAAPGVDSAAPPCPTAAPGPSPSIRLAAAEQHALVLARPLQPDAVVPAPPDHFRLREQLAGSNVGKPISAPVADAPSSRALIDSDNITGRKSINQYEVIEEIGRGMHGKVKLARNTVTGENVAIKIIPRFSKKRRLGRVTAMSPQDKTKKEIAILKKIRHPNVVALLEVIDDPELKKIYMVLEHVELGEVVWRKKGLPHICQHERRRIEREMRGDAPTAEEEQYNQLLERRQALKELKRARMAQNFAGPSDYWSVEHGAADEGSSLGRWSRIPSREDCAIADGHPSPPGSRRSSRAPSRSLSITSTGQPPTELDEVVDWSGDMETPMPQPSSTTALDGTMHGAYVQDGFRARSSSMADSIISHMSSVDYNPRAHDPFAEDFSFVPCFTLDQARSTFRDTVLGLEYLHYQGVVHRDIKPANLLWSKDHRVKISDFGVSYFGRPIRDGELDETVSESEAKDFDDDLELAKTVGTPAFFAPELCYTDLDKTEQPKVSEQIDVWSLGVTLYCLIYARIPFLAEDEFQMFKKIATEDVHISRRRLKPVDPSTSPSATSLYKRQNAHPYRDDNDLEYEEVDNLLYDLLRQMLLKNPEKRIRLRDIKRHPWVVQGIANPVGWIDDTDPARPSCGRKIQVDEKDMSFAVVPLNFLQRARSVMKKAVGKVMHPLGERSDSKSRRRATSSAASSAGDSMFRHTAPPTQYTSDRRGSLRVDDYFTQAAKDPSDHPAPASSTTDLQPETVAYDPLATVLPPLERPRESGPEESDNANRETGCSRRFQRQNGPVNLTSNFLNLNPALSHQTRSTPVTPHYHRPREDRRDGETTGRKTRGFEAQGDDISRSASVDRALFVSTDKRAQAHVALSNAVAPGNMQWPRHPRPMRSVDLGRGGPGHSNPSPLSSSPKTSTATYQHGQPQSDPNFHTRQQARVDERPQTAHRVESSSNAKRRGHRGHISSSPESLAPGASSSSPTKLASEQDEAQGADVDPVNIPCPPSPGVQEWAQHPGAPSRGNSMTTTKSCSMESMPSTGTPLTSPSLTTSPMATDGPPKNRSQNMLIFQSDPSLPALLSGASSISADMEGELLCKPGVVNQSPRLESADSITPPALAKDAASSFSMDHVFGNAPAMESGPLALHLQPPGPEGPGPVESATRPADDDDDNASDDGILLMVKSRKRTSLLPKASPARPFEAKRRDTGTSTASNETAKEGAR
ncbi:Serine/threonine-protein kinase ssp1 [Tolypocladium paradoxum]|uniref:non-specific serine/threonine protein kinase n=1 Tax=Tolypocladium paradoxum TaxID=94208 RepID=A0A2S4KQM5_9HYPO|nr:Serine/threonine-protein kinase ssp1 [Tolypocladium paradoxum]